METKRIKKRVKAVCGRRGALCLAALIVLLVAALLPEGRGKGAVKTPSLPFLPSERLTFKVSWGFIPAGEAVLEVAPLGEVEGVPARHFVMTARTLPFIDLFYKVRDRIDAYTDLAMTHTIHYREKRRGRREKNVEVNFDWEKGEARRSSSGKKKGGVAILPGTFDPLSVFYAFRLQRLVVGEEIVVPVSDGKKTVLGRAVVCKRESLSLGGKAYDTYLVEPDLQEVGGVFEKSKEAKLRIWVTADERKIPLRMESKVAVGSFVAELVLTDEPR